MPAHVRLLIVLLLSSVTVRTFTNDLGVLPKIFNLIDIPITYAILLLSLLRPAHYDSLGITSTVSRRLFAFALVLLAGGILNAGSSYLPAALAQVNLLLQPILLFIALLRLDIPTSGITSYRRVLKCLLVLQVVVGLLQLPGRIASGNSEAVHGTFPGNAEQFAAFTLIGVFYLIAILKLNPKHRLRCAAAIVVVLLLIISVDNKASWLGMACSVVVVLTNRAYVRNRVRWTILTIATLSLFGTFLAFVSSETSTTLYKMENLKKVVSEGGFFSLGKIKSYADVVRSWATSPYMVLVGAGPGTMYSRSGRQFYQRPGLDEQMYRNPGQLSEATETESRASDSLGGLISFSTKPPYYLRFFNERNSIVAIGSAQVDGPFSPYAGLLGETGILGSLLYLSIYVYVLKRLLSWAPYLQDSPELRPLHLGALGLMIYLLVNSVYGPFIETTRYTNILWSLVALVVTHVRARLPAPQLESIPPQSRRLSRYVN